jgi:hypothetical protein
MRVAASLMGLREFVPAAYTVPQMPIVGTDWPPVGVSGLADFVAANFAVPQNPILDAKSGMGDFVGAKFALPGYWGDSGLGDLVDTAPMYPLQQNSVLQAAQQLGMAGLAAGSDCGCGCSGHGGCGGGMGDISTWLSTQWTNIQAGDPTTLAIWGGGALLVALLLFGTTKRQSGYRAARRAALDKVRAQYPTYAGRARRAAAAF